MDISAQQIKEIIHNDIDPQIDLDIMDSNIPLIEQGIDSLDMYTLLLEIEEKFDVEIPDSDAEGLSTINAIIEYISQKTK